eukprot:gene12948-19966_t
MSASAQHSSTSAKFPFSVSSASTAEADVAMPSNTAASGEAEVSVPPSVTPAKGSSLPLPRPSTWASQQLAAQHSSTSAKFPFPVSSASTADADVVMQTASSGEADASAPPSVTPAKGSIPPLPRPSTGTLGPNIPFPTSSSSAEASVAMQNAAAASVAADAPFPSASTPGTNQTCAPTKHSPFHWSSTGVLSPNPPFPLSSGSSAAEADVAMQSNPAASVEAEASDECRAAEESDEERDSRARRQEWNGRATPTCYKWKQVAGDHGPPSRGRHTVGIDTQRKVLIMFGGQNYDLRQKYADVVEFDLEKDEWIAGARRSSSPAPVESDDVPCARSSHSSVVADDGLYVFGGATGKNFVSSPGCCKDAFTWKYTFATASWERVEGLDSISTRYGHTTVLTPNKIVYLFGGMTDMGCDWNTYKIDLRVGKVEKLDCSYVGSAGDVCGPFPDDAASSTAADYYAAHSVVDGHPKKKTAQQVRDCVRAFGHTAVYNPHTHSMYVLGGTVNVKNYHTAFLRLDLSTRRWFVEESVTPPPQGRYVHCASYDKKRNAMYVFGGFCGTYCNDVHEYDFATRRWIEIKPHPSSPDGPCLRSGACSVVWNDHVYIFGGCDDVRDKGGVGVGLR